MADRRITKDLFKKAIQCPTLGWYSVREQVKPPTPGEFTRMEEGRDIGARALSYFPSGLLIAGSHEDAVKETAALLQDSTVAALFEPAFQHGHYVTRADALLRHPSAEGFILSEVKSSVHKDSEIKDEHIDDIAYTAAILRNSGINIVSTEIVRISKDWRLGMPDRDMFRSKECTDAVFARVTEFEKALPTLAGVVLGSERPEPTHQKFCGECEYFERECLGKGVERSIHQLPRLSQKEFDQLLERGISGLDAIPDDFELTPPQARVLNACRTGGPAIDSEALSRLLGEVKWPAYYLDFETVKSAIPLYPGVAPHEQVVTQYSLHVCDAPGNLVLQHEFLAEASRDCRRELAEKLLEELCDAGSVIVYSSFEKTVLNSLATAFPDLRERFDRCVKRIFDLETVFKDAYCHPDFRGRTSLKAVLPVLVPDMSYEGLPVADGDTAIAMFLKLARGKCSETDTADIRRALLDYCGQDTLAMVKLHAVIAGGLGGVSSR